MPLIFLSYRRTSSEVARKIHDQLIRTYGSDAIFLDEKSIPLGINIRSYVRDTIRQCAVFLCLMDSNLLASLIASKEQDGDWPFPKDWVLIEISEALSVKDLTIIPVLIDVGMPRPEDLPRSLANLSYYNGIRILPERLDEDIPSLVRRIDRLIDDLSAVAPKTNSNSSSTKPCRKIQNRYGFSESFLQVETALLLHMALIPGGDFLMGSSESDPEYNKREYPKHRVSLSSFFMGRYPVTQAQYKAVMGSNPSSTYDEDRFISPNKPVVGVSWYDSVSFCERLAEITGRPYRLPTEAEWEYACRAGTTTPFHFGKTLTTEVANFDGNYTYASGPKGEFRNGTTSVDHFGIANAFGLSDMHGNVSEWCQDYWHENYENAPTDGTAWTEDGNPSYRVRRGGSWFFEPAFCRSAYRDDFGLPELSDSHIGFRVCCSAPAAFQ
ncbi:SUMF1/EgtB/PvdO family nonheme iron enzyme [Nodosilinea sp. PGN35]|uniref:SUMF1/EgtB/PvdO family nonheme iron enzyme n=1 Tax=Nodosilinea sp. PGN35 TaxID=3020489 RepID=UPI0023B2DF27|nr:SUMF1/EgtB/PvdO family nonheme iron enzyme [Nodosilinea sp. TSF1-S3]MDF0369137.1 SUMF1/EgtB/PvdO family nonheme iron enzyme [Nodosilinea sp. TSF1-S3]